MKNVLAIETTGKISSVALIDNDGNKYFRTSSDEMNHLRDLVPMIDSLLKEAGIRKFQISLLAISEGPGSFTGIRIGMATAKGLAKGLGIPLVPVPTLESFAKTRSFNKSQLICPLMDARRNSIYACAFTIDDIIEKSVNKVAINKYLKTDIYVVGDFISQILNQLSLETGIREVIFLGDAVEKYKIEIERLKEEVGKRGLAVEIEMEEKLHQSALNIAACADIFQPITYSQLKPLYVQIPEAERKLKAGEHGLKKKKAEETEEIMELPDENEVIGYRIADKSDVKAMARLDALCFGRSWSEDLYNEEFNKGKDAFYVVALSEDDEVIGLAGINYIAGEGEIDRVLVHPLYRARGIACKLLEMLWEDAKSKNVSNISLEVSEANPIAIGLYKSFGFKVEGKRLNYYADTGENALIMWKRSERGVE